MIAPEGNGKVSPPPRRRRVVLESPAMRALSVVFSLVVVGLAGSTAACSRPTREWNANDHDDEPGPPGGAQQGPAAGNASAMLQQMGPEELAGLVEGVWKNVCVQCHGPGGKGDGPNGPMVGAADLGAQVVQARTDEQLAEAIQKGKGKMPGYPKLPPVFVQGLVGKIRSFKAP